MTEWAFHYLRWGLGILMGKKIENLVLNLILCRTRMSWVSSFCFSFGTWRFISGRSGWQGFDGLFLLLMLY